MSLSRLRSTLSSASPAYLALSCFGLAASPALAQEQTEAKPASLGSVTVTDTALDDDGIKVDRVASPKFTQKLQDTPQTITVIDKKLFNQQGATTLTEALRNSPGVGAFYAGENGNTTTGDAIRMRGFDTSNSIYVDGVRDLGSISRDIFNTEQIEVVKGPAGTDNGRSAPTGAINMVSKRANADQAASAIVSVGVDGQKRANADLNVPLEALANTAVRLNAVWQDSDVPGRDHVNNSHDGIAASIGTGLGTDTRVFVNVLHVNQHNIPDGYVPTFGLDSWSPYTDPAANQSALIGHPVKTSNFYGTRNDHDDVKANMATLIAEHDFSDAVKLTNTARWGSTAQNYLITSYMGTATNLVCASATDPSTCTIKRSSLNTKDAKNGILTDQLNLRADFETGPITHNLSAGAEFTKETYKAWGLTTVNALNAANVLNPDWDDNPGTVTISRSGAITKGQTDTQAFYVFDTAKLFDEKLLITGGIRVDHYKTNYVTISAVGATTLDATKKGTLFNWKIGAVAKPIETVSIYANYAISQQPPGGDAFTLLANDSTSANANNPNMKPQKAKTAEIGVKASVLGDKLALTAALFKTRVLNEIYTDPTDSTNLQAGSKHVSGIELSAVGNITQAWSISAGFSHQKTKVAVGAGVSADLSDALTYAPEDAFTSWTTYKLPFGLELGGGVRYTGGLKKGTDGAVGTPTLTDGYTLVDAIASYAVTDNLKLRVNAYNVFDKSYILSINKSGYRYNPGTPRTFLFSAEANF